jgi:hypothetical protein
VITVNPAFVEMMLAFIVDLVGLSVGLCLLRCERRLSQGDPALWEDRLGPQGMGIPKLFGRTAIAISLIAVIALLLIRP